MRKVAVVTGTRAEFGLFIPILREMKRTEGMDYRLYVTGMHLSDEFGLTIKQIESDRFKVAAKLDVLNTDDTGSGMARYAGHLAVELARVWEKDRPDIVLVLGDRSEMLSAAFVANCMNIPVAHIHGGEVSGSVDDGFRHAITKLAHIHFPATKGSAERIRKMGEDLWRIKVVGAPGLDGVRPTQEEVGRVSNKFGVDQGRPLILVVQHSVVQEYTDAGKQIRTTLEAVADSGFQTVIIYPNADPGGREMIRVIEEFIKDTPQMRAFKSLGRMDYICILSMTSVMVGNSSSGIIEAPFFKVPFVNIGTRQRGRERASNVIDVPSDARAIRRAIRCALEDTEFRTRLGRCKSPYGRGKASERIVGELRQIKIDDRLLHKKLRY